MGFENDFGLINCEGCWSRSNGINRVEEGDLLRCGERLGLFGGF